MGILITGSTGFVGRHLVNLFESSENSEDIIYAPQFDVRCKKEVDEIIRYTHFDKVIHLAAQSSVPDSFCDPNSTFDVNLYGTLNLLESLEAVNFTGRFLYVSSGDVYGLSSRTTMLTESTALLPTNPYAVSKIASEYLCLQKILKKGADIVIARPFNHIGYGQSENFAISSFAKQLVEIKMQKKEAVISVGNLDVYRDFTNVIDVCNAYKCLLYKGKSGEVYNIASQKQFKIGQLLLRMMDILNIKVEIKVDKNKLRGMEQDKVNVNCEKIARDTGWTPKISIDDSLVEILNYWEIVLNG